MKKIVTKSIKNKVLPTSGNIKIVGYRKGMEGHCVSEILRLGKGGNIIIRPKYSSKAC